MVPGRWHVDLLPCPKSVPNTRRIGCAKLPALYWVIGLGSGKPQSHGGARRTACEAKRWIT